MSKKDSYPETAVHSIFPKSVNVVIYFNFFYKLRLKVKKKHYPVNNCIRCKLDNGRVSEAELRAIVLSPFEKVIHSIEFMLIEYLNLLAMTRTSFRRRVILLISTDFCSFFKRK